MNSSGLQNSTAWSQAEGGCWPEPDDIRSVGPPNMYNLHSSLLAQGVPSVMGQGVHCQKVWFLDIGSLEDKTHLQFSPGIELAQALHSFLTMHHGCHRGSLLKAKQTGL